MATRALGLERIRSNANVDSLVTQDYADHWIELQVPLNLKEHVGKIHFDISRGNWQSPHICMEAKSGARIYGRIPLTTLQQWATAEHASSPA